MMPRMYGPHALVTGEHQPVEHGARALQDADDDIRMLFMRIAAGVAEAMRAGKRGTRPVAGARRHFGAEHRFQRLLPQPSGPGLRAVQRHITGRGADNAEAAMAVAQRQWNRLLHGTMARDFLRLLPGDVAGRHVEVVNGREDDLQRTALGADHQIDAAGIALHALFQLFRGEQQQDDGRHAQRQQQHVERGAQAARAQIRQADGCDIHGCAASK